MEKQSLNHLFQKSFPLGILIGFVLIVLGRILIPTTNPLSLGAAGLILGIYGLVYCFGLPRSHPEILHWAGRFGLLAGAIFVGEILLEYILLPKDNTNWGLIEFGGVFLLYFLSSVWASYHRDSIRAGVLSAILTAMGSALLWLIVILITFYVFRGTDRQTQVFRAEGNFVDFADSRMSDFNAFIMEDFLGAGFFHLLLGPVLATILGAPGGLLGKRIARLRKIRPKS